MGPKSSDRGATEPVWGPDGREIFYKNAERALMATAVGPGEGTDFRVGESEILFSAEDYNAYAFQPQYDVSPDGERFLMIRLPFAASDQYRMILVRNWLTEVLAELGR